MGTEVYKDTYPVNISQWYIWKRRIAKFCNQYFFLTFVARYIWRHDVIACDNCGYLASGHSVSGIGHLCQNCYRIKIAKQNYKFA